jgi:hypothetical protein
LKVSSINYFTCVGHAESIGNFIDKIPTMNSFNGEVLRTIVVDLKCYIKLLTLPILSIPGRDLISRPIAPGGDDTTRISITIRCMLNRL